MSTALATRPALPETIEKALVYGDLKDLDAAGRVSYYNAVCTSLGLNPLTKPFAYITLNGKLTLYALRDCTEQLRKIHGVSITGVTPSQVGDLIVVVVTAQDRTGRIDSSTGAVNVAGLKGENLANAMMKCETKGKRRVTLSLCGLGILDETEVDTLREQGVAKPEQIAAEAKWDALDPPKSPEVSNPSPEAGRAQDPPSAGQQGAFSVVGDRMTCIILDVLSKQTKPGKNGQTRPYLDVIWNGRYEGFNHGVCFDTKLFDPLKAAMSHEISLTFEWQEGQTTPPKIIEVNADAEPF